VYLSDFHVYINEIYGTRSKIPSKKSRSYIHDVKFLALLEAPYIYDISRLRVKGLSVPHQRTQTAYKRANTQNYTSNVQRDLSEYRVLELTNNLVFFSLP
jgi:hypothetical protein